MILSHRLRLALVSASATGLVLAALFGAITLLAKNDVLNDKKTELDSVMRSFTPRADARFDIEEFEEAHPEMSASVFDVRGWRIGDVGREPPRRVNGFQIEETRLLLGTRFKGENVVLSLGLEDSYRGLRRLQVVLAAIWLPLTLLVGAATWLAAQSVFRPLDRLSAQAIAMSGRDLSERLLTPDRAEFGTFAERMNGMLDRIEETLQRGERFSTDAAHELRTPLAILRTRLETALIQPRSVEAYEATLRRSISEIERLTSITESLLCSARGEAGPAEPIDLMPIVSEATERWTERFTSKGVELEAIASSAEANTLPDEARIVLDNLLDNALRYAPANSKVSILLSDLGPETRLSVRDAGPGISPKLGERVFDRFVRGDEDRNRASGGAGIGLSVCRRIVSQRGGKMALATPPEGGAEIVCLYPKPGSER